MCLIIKCLIIKIAGLWKALLKQLVITHPHKQHIDLDKQFHEFTSLLEKKIVPNKKPLMIDI